LIKGSAGSDAIAANSLGVAGGYVAQGTELVALRQKLTTTSAELVALRAKQLDDEVAGVVQAAMGVKLSPGQRESMIELGKTNIALLKSVIESAPPVVPHGELAAADLTIGVAQSGFVVPRGCEVDVASAALCSKAEDYAAKHGVDFLVAVKKVQSI
jgi:phage I-like protein